MTRDQGYKDLVDQLSSEIEGVRWTEDGRDAPSVGIAHAVLAVIAEKAKEWPTERMVKAWSDTLRNVMDYSDTESAEATLCAREDWSLMLAASPLVKPEDPK